MTRPEKHVYFALDSDVLSNMAELYSLKEQNPDKHFSEIRSMIHSSKQFKLNENLNFYNELLELAKSDKIRFLVTCTPFYESRHIESVIKFIKDVCYLPKVHMTNFKQEANEVRRLAHAYCTAYTNKEGVKRNAPLSPRYNAHYGDLAPSNDAYVMAEATVCHACLITENGKDLLFNSFKQENSKGAKKDNDRVRGIVEINLAKGYFEPNTSEAFGSKGYVVPRPYSIEGVGQILKYHRDGAVFVTSEDSAFQPAEEESRFM